MCFVDLSAWGIYKGLEDYTHSWRVCGCYYTYLISSQNCLVMLLHMHALCVAWKTTMITGNSLILNMDVSQLESCHTQTGLSEFKKKIQSFNIQVNLPIIWNSVYTSCSPINFPKSIDLKTLVESTILSIVIVTVLHNA